MKEKAGYESFLISLPNDVTFYCNRTETDGCTQTVRVHVRACECVSSDHHQEPIIPVLESSKTTTSNSFNKETPTSLEFAR